jgi:hypothetical protein
VPSTTLPEPPRPPDVTGCLHAPTFASVACRLDALGTLVRDRVVRASLREALLGRLRRAGAKSVLAAAQMTTGGRRRARASLRRAVSALARFRGALRSRTERRAISSARRAVLRADARGIERDLRRMRRGL